MPRRKMPPTKYMPSPPPLMRVHLMVADYKSAPLAFTVKYGAVLSALAHRNAFGFPQVFCRQCSHPIVDRRRNGKDTCQECHEKLTVGQLQRS